MIHADIVDKAKRGDREALREVVRMHYPSVLRFLTTLCANPSDAEELTQEVFVKALSGLRRFRAESGLRTWLHRIAFHEYTRRRRRERPPLPFPDDLVSPFFETSSVLALDLESALRCVPEEFRTAFVLCDVQGLSMQEAADVMAVPLGTAKSRLHSARQRLQSLLSQEPDTQTRVQTHV